jgi:quinol monooxygenase YgiN
LPVFQLRGLVQMQMRNLLLEDLRSLNAPAVNNGRERTTTDEPACAAYKAALHQMSWLPDLNRFTVRGAECQIIQSFEDTLYLETVMTFPSWRWIAAAAALQLASAAHSQTATPYRILAYYDTIPAGQTQPGGDSALAILTKYTNAASAEVGASSVKVLTDVGRASRFTVIETWASAAAYNTHAAGAAVTQLKTAISPWLVGPTDERSHVLYK